MKNISPRRLAIYVALLIAVVLFLFSLIGYSTGFLLLDWWWILLVPTLFFIFVYNLILFILTKYIYRKVKLIYKNIQHFKRKGPDAKVKIKLDSDILTTVQKDVSAWAESQAEEIATLRSMEEYRRNFLGNISHELKTPIFNMQGYLFTLAEGGLYDANINKDYLERALVNVKRLQTIVDDLEVISRLESGEVMLDQRDFDIYKLIEESLDDHFMLAKAKNIKMSFKKGADVHFNVRGDRENIRTVLNNLLANSIKYGNENGKTTIGCYNMESYILVEVTDNGIGIEQKHLKHVFDRFYRVDKSGSREVGGSGLGLSIVKHIVEAHDQTISVRSEKGKGTTFGFTLKSI